MLNAHHIESYYTNRFLRYDPRNGMALCPLHHRFGRESAHKSFVMVLVLMLGKRGGDLTYLLANWRRKSGITKRLLLGKIKELEKELEGIVK